MKLAHFRFDDDLRALLQRPHADGGFEYSFNGPQSVKHLVESVGIPHTEIGLIVANGQLVSPSYLVQDGDWMDVRGNEPAALAGEPHFVLDGHLGRLNAHLRMLGLDCLYETDYTDPQLIHISNHDDRILLTRDRRMLMNKLITHGYLVRSLDPEQQLRELVRRFALRDWMHPFRRCIRCNHLLQPITKAEVIDRLEPLTKLYFDEFRICPSCGQIYWKGSHFDRMLSLIASLPRDPPSPAA